MTKNLLNLISSASAVALVLASAPVAAEASDSSAAATASNLQGAAKPEADAIVVTGLRASLEKSIEIKRKATGISDAITAEDIGKFPDLNISESLQRIPGVTLDRNTFGEGQSINLRGLGSEFTLVEVDGLSGTSNGTGGRFQLSGGGRGFNFEILASELFASAIVNKTSLPALTEGGLAGTVQLETPHPLDQKQGFHASASALGNYSELGKKVDPRGALLLSYNDGDRFGIVASLASSDTHFLSDTIEGGSWRPFAFANSGTRAPDDIRAAVNANGPRYYHFTDHRKTFGSTATVQFRPTDQFNFTLDGIYANLKSDRLALRDDMAIEGGANDPISTTIVDGVITSGQFTGIQQRVGANFMHTNEDFFQVSGKVKWTPDDYWTITPLVGYSSRKAARSYDLYSFRLADSSGAFDPGIVSYNVRGNFLDFSSTATDFMSNPKNFLFNVFIFRPSTDKDTEFTSKLDFERKFDSALDNIQFGVRYSDRNKGLISDQTRLQRSSGVAAIDLPNLGSMADLVDFHVRGGGTSVPSQILSANVEALRAAFFPNGQPVAGTYIRPFPSYAAQQTYSIEERTLAAYAQAEFKVTNFDLITGVRYVQTDQTASGSQVANAFLPSEQIIPVTAKNNYSFFLPSMTARWNVMHDIILRAAYSRTLTRPNLADLAPSESFNGIDASGGTGSIGNPDLQPYTSDNFDLGAEWYFSRDGLIGGNVFYKDIKGFIDSRTFVEDRTYPRQADGVLVTGPITFVQPVNSASAKIRGFEVTMQSRLGFIMPALKNFGFIANYSFTDSSANFSQANDVRSRGLPGLSRHSYNLVGYFDDGRFDARFAYAWRDRYLAQFADDFGIPRFTDSFGQLDFSADYKLSSQISLQLQALNLTKAQSINKSSSLYLPYGVAELDRRFLFGARVKF